MNRRSFLSALASILPASIAARFLPKPAPKQSVEVWAKTWTLSGLDMPKMHADFERAYIEMEKFTDVEGNPTSGRPSKINVLFTSEKEIWFDFSKGETA